jgi:hypothetical protein
MSTRPWYLADGGKRLGPYEPEAIPGLVQSGAIRHATLVWNEDLEGWMAARDVPEMKLYLRGVPEEAASPAAVSTDVLSKLVAQVAAEVTAEVMGNFDSFTKEAAVTKSGRHVAVDGAPARKAPERAPAPVAKPAEPAAKPAAAVTSATPAANPAVPAAAARPAPAPATVPVAAALAPAPRPPEAVARPVAAVPVAASPARVPSTPSIPAVSARPASTPHPFGSMPPDPYASRSHAVPGRLPGPVEIPMEFLRTLGKVIKGVGCLGILVGVICVLFAIDKSVGGPMQRIAWFGVFSVPLVVGLGTFGFGFFLDLWLAQAERLRPVLEAARKDEGPAHDAGESRRGVLPYSG